MGFFPVILIKQKKELRNAIPFFYELFLPSKLHV